MMYTRVSSGLDFLDASIGGLYSNRNYLVRGPSQSGRTTFALQFLRAGIENGENGLMISNDRIENVILKAEAMGINLEEYLNDNRLILIEYPKVILGRQYTYGTIVQLLGEIEQYISHYGCSRLVFDTLHPLMMMSSESQLVNYIYSLMNSLEALNVTTLVTTGDPNSQTAQRIIQLIEDAVVGSFVLSKSGTDENLQRLFSVHKMINRQNPPLSFKMKMEYGEGLVQDMGSKRAHLGVQTVKNRTDSIKELPLHIGILDQDEDTMLQIEEIFHKDSVTYVFGTETELQTQMMNLDCDLFLLNVSPANPNWRRTLTQLRDAYPKLPIFLYIEKRNARLTYQTAKIAGADGLFIKPFTPLDLIKTLEKALKVYGTLDELIEKRSITIKPGVLPEDFDVNFPVTDDEEPNGAMNLQKPSAFKALLSRQIWQSNQSNATFALVSFKMVYIGEMSKLSHLPQGLELVKNVAQIITSSLRGINDSACRYMDKVVVLLEDTERDGALAFANRVINELSEELGHKYSIQVGRHLNVLTATSIYPEDGDNVNDLMSQVTDVSKNFVKIHA
ncbi:MAG: ATPase domain-containing protein [Candidatus Hatepunaea meridiana]|nr:ATPase domain-containing protein [Candidatus Hatepunaea meridiana]